MIDKEKFKDLGVKAGFKVFQRELTKAGNLLTQEQLDNLYVTFFAGYCDSFFTLTQKVAEIENEEEAAAVMSYIADELIAERERLEAAVNSLPTDNTDEPATVSGDILSRMADKYFTGFIEAMDMGIPKEGKFAVIHLDRGHWGVVFISDTTKYKVASLGEKGNAQGIMNYLNENLESYRLEHK
jgi:hypothetical protein